MLHNFAGNVEMYGILDSIASGPVDARKSENSTMASLSNCGFARSFKILSICLLMLPIKKLKKLKKIAC